MIAVDIRGLDIDWSRVNTLDALTRIVATEHPDRVIHDDIDHGTLGGYSAHYRQSRPVCAECADAHSEYARSWRSRAAHPSVAS